MVNERTRDFRRGRWLCWLACVLLAALPLWGQRVPEGGWEGATVRRPAEDRPGPIQVVRAGRTLANLSFPQADRLPLTQVSVEDGELVIDARETLRDGGKLTLNIHGIDASRWRAQIAEVTVELSGPEGAQLHLYFEGSAASRPHYYTMRRQTLRTVRPVTLLHRYELAEDLKTLHVRLDMLTPGVYRVRSAAVGLASEPEALDLNYRPELLFHASFDGTATPEVARGAAEPLVAKGLSYDAGVKGQALRMTKAAGSSLAYALKGNVIPERGAVTLWYKPEWQPENRPFDYRVWRNLFGFERIEPRVGSGAIWLWNWDNQLRGDTADNDDQYKLMTHALVPGQWHHIAFTWDERGGVLYCNGKSGSGISDGWSPMVAAIKQLGRPSYSRPDFKRFFVGSMFDGEQAEGLIDDLRIYSTPLSAAQIREQIGQKTPLQAVLTRRYFNAGEPVAAALGARNTDAAVHQATWRILDAEGRQLAAAAKPVAVPGQTTVTLDVQAAPLKPGRHELVFADEQGGEQRIELWAFHERNPELSQAKDLRLELVETIRLDQPLPPERFNAVGETAVRELDGVRYLETAEAPGSRFAVRVRLPGDGHLYCFEFDYPDNRRRTADILVQTCRHSGSEYELQTGYACGDEYPSQNRIVTSQCLYWAADKDVAVVVMSPRPNEPAAMAAIRVYRVLDGLPPVAVNEAPKVDGWNRAVALYFEDPAINYDFAANGGRMPGLETMIDRVVADMKYTGENLLAYPGVWYQGIIGDWYNPRAHATAFLDAFYTRFDREGLMLMPTFNQNNQPVPENLVTLRTMRDGSLHPSPCTIWDNGRPNPGLWHDNPPNFNISHPSVQEGILKDFEEMLAQGAPHPSFKGFVMHLTRHCLHWFGDLKAGYNDYTIEMFEKATGIRVPVDRKDPLRGKLYAEWLLANCREQWIAWRCEFMAAWWKRLARRLAEVRPDLRLVLNSFSPVTPNYEDFLDPDIVVRRNREAGLDARLFADTPNIVICQSIVPADYRWRGKASNKTPEIDERMRNLDLHPRTYASLDGVRIPWVHQHDRYWESAVGRTRASLTNDWLKEHGWRVTTINPSGFHALRHYVAPLRYHDLLGVSKGGFLIGTYGMEAYLRPFAAAFRALPAVVFDDLAGSTEFVKVRTKLHNGRRWFYVVNTHHEPAEMALRLTAAATDLVSGEAAAPGTLRLSLKPYELRSFSLPADASVSVAP